MAKVLTKKQVQILQFLKDNSGKSISKTDIFNQTGFGKGTILRVFKLFQDKKYITIESNFTNTGKQLSNSYVITPEGEAALSARLEEIAG